MTTQATPLRTTARIREEFLDYFAARHGHAVVPSSPVIPHNDPTLMFINAGMNQFKDVFLGQGERPYRRAVNSQKCIRAGGKHNDLEDVGKDHYHHTFFEMLGNWSFGDYFKEEAITWAWELLTEVWGVDPSRLYVTVFAGDPQDGLGPDIEAEEIWKRFVDPARLSRWGRKDNFWEMGDTGPCGPCSEIHYDGRSSAERERTPGVSLVNTGHADVVEIWNLVFIQFNRAPGEDGQPGRLTALPARHVDTGMGLERVARVLQGKPSNYDTDLWSPIFEAIQRHTRAHPYRGSLEDPVDIAYRVIADHVRCLTVALSDGARPSNEKAGYVLRRILRRAVRHAHQTLGVEGPLLFELVPTVVQTLGEAFPELRKNPEHIAKMIHDEEESFLRTLDRGLILFGEAADRATAGGGAVLLAEDAFTLHDTYGFPIDLTRVMAEERGLQVDESGFEELRDEARERSRQGVATTPGATAIEALGMLPPEMIARLRHLDVQPTDDHDKYADQLRTARIVAIWNGRDLDERSHAGRSVALILNRTAFYAESGGQVGDHGQILRGGADFGSPAVRGSMGREGRPDFRFKVQDTRAVGGYVLHIGHTTEGEPQVGDEVTCHVDERRRTPTQANHTATHLLNHALRELLGDDVEQRGSLVAPDRLRFDFSWPTALSDEQLEHVQQRVNAAIARQLVVNAEEVPLEQARTIAGVRAVFGERYPDPVRVVSIGPLLETVLADPTSQQWREFSIEFCGGTHLRRTGEAHHFVILQEQALAAGVRRITALTGPAAEAAESAGADLQVRLRTAATLDGAALVEAFEELAPLVDEMTVPASTRHRLHRELEPLRASVKEIRKQGESGAREHVVQQAHQLAEHAEGDVLAGLIDGADQDLLLAAIDVLRSRRPGTAAILFSPDVEHSRVAIVAAVPKMLIQRGLKAGDWVKRAASECGGGGGGRPDLAQAGGKDPSRLSQALDAARAFAHEKLGG